MQFKNERLVFICAGLVSILLSVWMSVREAVINPDAICYLLSAAEVKDGLHAAMHICSQAKWPFYSVLIYYFSLLTHLPMTASAYCLDGIFSLISVLTFIKIIRCITTKINILWFAAIVILFSHEFNSVRQYIVRDHGFWAFYLLSILFLLNFYQKKFKWRYAVMWSGSLVIATLFRIEGAVFLLLIPFITLFDLRQTLLLRVKAFLKLYTITIIGGLFLIVIVILHPQIELTRLYELSAQLSNGVEDMSLRFTTIKQVILQHIIPNAKGEVYLLIFLMLTSWFLISILSNLSWAYAALVGYAWFQKSFVKESSVRLIVWSYIIINLLITFSFLAEHLFLSKRYLVALTLVLMLWVPFALDTLINRFKNKKIVIWIMLFFMGVSSAGGLIDFGYSKKYIHDAGDWIATHIPKDASLYCNDYQVMYYSQHYGKQIFIKAHEFVDLKMKPGNRYKYLALRINKSDQTQAIKQKGYVLINEFANKRGDTVKIYHRSTL